MRSIVLLISLLLNLCALNVSHAAPTLHPVKGPRIGVLGAGPASEHIEDIEVLGQALRELGWVNERAISFEQRYADGHYEKLPGLAAELVALKVNLIFAVGGTPAIEAAMKATHEIPIVFPTVGDPVAQKLVESMKHPGGNATGLSNMTVETNIKRLELLKEALPATERVALLVNGANPATAYFVPLSQSASQSLGIRLQAFDIRDSENFEKTFEKMSRAGMQAVIVEDDFMLDINTDQFGLLALKHRLPLLGVESSPGVLVTYSRDTPALYRRAATYVDKILKGTSPGDLPIEQPTKFRLIINLRTADALSVRIPQALLLRADEIIH